MSDAAPRPRVFPMSRANARMNNPTSRSVRLVTPEASGQGRLYAGAFWSDPGADAGWAFVPDDPDMNSMAGGIPHLGDHDEVYLCLAGRILADWEGNGERGSFEFGAGDVVHWPAGFTIRNRVIGDEPAHVFWVMGPAPEWMMPLTEPAPSADRRTCLRRPRRVGWRSDA